MAYRQDNFTGALFVNSDKDSDKHPDRNGSCTIEGKQYWISGWDNESDSGKRYIGLKFKEKEEPRSRRDDDRRDDRRNDRSDSRRDDRRDDRRDPPPRDDRRDDRRDAPRADRDFDDRDFGRNPDRASNSRPAAPKKSYSDDMDDDIPFSPEMRG